MLHKTRTSSFLQQKYGLSCSLTLEDHPDKTKSITSELTGSLFENSPICLDVTNISMDEFCHEYFNFYRRETVLFI